MSFGKNNYGKKPVGKKKEGPVGKIIIGLFSVLCIGALYFGLKIFGPNTGSFRQNDFFYISTGATYPEVLQSLEKNDFVRNIKSFDFLAKKAKYPSMVKAGKYHIAKGMSNYDIVRMLRSGRQTPVKLIIKKLRTKNEFISYVTTHLEADSLVMKRMLNDNVYLAQFGLDSNTAMCAILPDTYEMWWNTNADIAYRKMEKYYVKYWTDERKQKAATKGLKPTEVVTIASIVEEETNYQPEKSNIASVYMNRLKNGMKLQADPTAKFAYGDFTLRRITSVVTSIESPYNTYYTTGLPPGPICTPSKKTIEAVLNAPKTDYLYFCAKEDFSGSHRFSSSLDEHHKNARLYQQALNARGIH